MVQDRNAFSKEVERGLSFEKRLCATLWVPRSLERKPGRALKALDLHFQRTNTIHSGNNVEFTRKGRVETQRFRLNARKRLQSVSCEGGSIV